MHWPLPLRPLESPHWGWSTCICCWMLGKVPAILGWPSCASGQELRKAHTRAESLTPVATGFPVCFITIGVRSLMATDSPAHLSPSGLPPPWQPCHIHTVLTECSKAASEADPCGWPTCRGGAKTTAELQGL